MLLARALNRSGSGDSAGPLEAARASARLGASLRTSSELLSRMVALALDRRLLGVPRLLRFVDGEVGVARPSSTPVALFLLAGGGIPEETGYERLALLDQVRPQSAALEPLVGRRPIRQERIDLERLDGGSYALAASLVAFRDESPAR